MSDFRSGRKAAEIYRGAQLLTVDGTGVNITSHSFPLGTIPTEHRASISLQPLLTLVPSGRSELSSNLDLFLEVTTFVHRSWAMGRRSKCCGAEEDRAG